MNSVIAGRRLVFFGNERIATAVGTDTPILKALTSQGYDIAAVVSNYEPSQSRNGRALEIAAVAQQHGIPVLLPSKPGDIRDQLAAYGATAAILVAYGKIVPQSVIDIFPQGIINIHPSLLPLHRGPTPLESVMLEGAAETGVSIMQLAKEMDAGPIYGQIMHALHGNESKQQLAGSLLDRGKDLLLELLPAILDGSLRPKPQAANAATYDPLITKQDGILDFDKSASRLEREVRAYAGWPGSRTILGGKDVVVTAAHADNGGNQTPSTIRLVDKKIAVGTSDGLLIIDKLKPAGKPEMTAAAFLAGYGHLITDK